MDFQFEYYFVIAGIKILIRSSFEIKWNSYLKVFQKAARCINHTDVTEDADWEVYECILTDNLEPLGELVHEGFLKKIFLYEIKGLVKEERLQYFEGFELPAILYREEEGVNRLYLNKCFIDAFICDENFCIFNAIAFEKLLLKHDSLVLHCSYIIDQGQAVLFSAPSGTGKSTQAVLWEKHRNALIVNGDRAVLKVCEDGAVLALGLPLCGSSDICLDKTASVKAIAYLWQSPEDQVQIVRKSLEMKLLLSEITINYHSREFVDKAFNLIEKITMAVPMFELGCTISEGAVACLETAINAM